MCGPDLYSTLSGCPVESVDLSGKSQVLGVFVSHDDGQVVNAQ